QRKAFREQRKLAKELEKPLVIHCRPSKNSMDAYHDLYEILSEDKKIGDIVMHFFAGNEEVAKKFIDLDCYFTFGGVITLTRDYDEQLKMVPVDKLLLETDAPYVSPLSHRGERNEPRFVREVYERVSKLRKIGLDKLKEHILKNNKKVFDIDV
ncbi:MAG TPA: TatD family hydrolase, partial [Candidatus Paceibacterota bacterium]|nr:TatD family hydrolase [Candidatus Paceibacterota bacterium]